MSGVKFNRWIKVLLIVCTVLLLASFGLIASSCKKCQHEYDARISKQAGCDTVGEVTYTCKKCGDFYTEEISALGVHSLSSAYLNDGEFHWQKCANCEFTTEKTPHDYATVVSSEQSTCTKQGNVVKSCECGKTHSEVLPLANHDYSIYKKQDDKHWKKCKNCDATTPKENHEFTIQGAITPSTCVEQGVSVKLCVCGEELSEQLPLISHDYSLPAFDAIGHWTACSVCLQAQPNQSKTPHTIVQVSKVEAECEKDGKLLNGCSGCSYLEDEVILPALNHDLSESLSDKTSTQSHHFYKCNRCGKDIGKPHEMVVVSCPDGYDRAPTCYKEGHQDNQCTVCSFRTHTSIAMTNEHNLSTEWSSNGTFHWHACTNGDGKDTCDFRSDEAQHIWKEVIVDATCTENGSRQNKCECGQVQTGSNKTLPKLGHDYKTTEVITEATCSHEGLVKQRCSRCQDEIETVTDKLDHDMSTYKCTQEGHYRKCSNCGFTQETMRNHTWLECVVKEASCTENGLTICTCKDCEYAYEQVTTKNHHYVTDDPSFTDPTKFAAPTCTEAGWYMATCEYCQDHQRIEMSTGLAPHSPKEYDAKEMTETEPGNRHYWQCTVCKKYFTTHTCTEELSKEDVFQYPPSTVVVESVAKLIEIANGLTDGTESNDYYQVTTPIIDTDANSHMIIIGDDANMLLITLSDRENVSTLKVGDTITIKGKISVKSDDVTLTDCKIIDVDRGDDKLHSVFIDVTEEYAAKSRIFASADSGTFRYNTNNYNCVEDGGTVYFYFYPADPSIVVQKLIINGKAYTMSGGILEICVTDDVYAEFVLDTDRYCSVTINEVNTNNNGNEVVVDEYISYSYTNDNNVYGRLYKNSHLTFTANNANITGISITYDAEWLAENPDVLQNTVYAVKENGSKVTVSQGTANKLKVVINLSAEDAYVALEYFANVSQARVAEITVRYQTCNT